MFLGLRRKPVKSLTRGLLCSRRPQAPSWWAEGTECFLKRVLEARAEKWTQRASELQRISLKKRERERETVREREKTRGPKLWWSDGVLFNIVWVFILSYKAAIFSRDKIKTYKLSRKHEVIHMKERGL